MSDSMIRRSNSSQLEDRLVFMSCLKRRAEESDASPKAAKRLRSRLRIEDEDRAFADGHLLLGLLNQDTDTDAVDALAAPSSDSSAQWPREVFVWFFLDRVNEDWDFSNFLWEPKLKFVNVVSQEPIQDDWFEVCNANFERISPEQYIQQKPAEVWIRRFTRLKATFAEKMDFKPFPFDMQLLNMTLTTQHPVTTALLRFCDRDSCADMMTETTHLQEFDFQSPRMIAYDQPAALSSGALLMSKPDWSRTGTQYSWLHIAPVIVRHAAPYFWSIMFPQCMLVSLAFVVFCIDPQNFSARIEIDLNIILATITFRLTIADQLPKMAYLTALGAYCQLSLLFLGLVVFENFAVHFWNFDSRRELPLVAVLMLSWLLLNAAEMHPVLFPSAFPLRDLSLLREASWPMEASDLMAAPGPGDGPPSLGVARAGRLQSVFNPLVPTCMDHPHSQKEQVGRLVHLFEREIDTLDGELGGHHAVVKPGFPRWARSPGSCAEKAAEVIAFYQQQICALEARLAERKRARAGGFSSATSAILSSESQTSPDRTPASRLFRCTPGNALPSGSDTSFTTWGAVAAVEWIGQLSVQEMRLRFVGEADDSESSEQPEPGWQRKDLFEGEHLCMLRGRHLGWLMWVLTEPSQQLSKLFPGREAPVVTVLRRPYTTQERAELFQ
ncbi:GABRQ, partial [Symbiodinium sp. KB8]